MRCPVTSAGLGRRNFDQPSAAGQHNKKLGHLVTPGQLDRGDFTGVPRDAPLAQSAPSADRAKPEESIMELFERFAGDQRRQNPDTLDQSRKIIRRFAEFVGGESAASAVSRTNAREWKFALQS